MNDTRKKARGLKIALVVVSILVIISLIANLYLYFKTGDLQSQVTDLTNSQNNLQNQVANLSNDLNYLQNQVNVIEEKIKPKEWTFVGEYNLTHLKQEETFHVTGEKWRFRWEFPFTFTGGGIMTLDNVRIYDENDYLIDEFSLGDKINEKGIHYIEQGNGNFTIRVLDVRDEFIFLITVESYQ